VHEHPVPTEVAPGSSPAVSRRPAPRLMLVDQGSPERVGQEARVRRRALSAEVDVAGLRVAASRVEPDVRARKLALRVGDVVACEVLVALRLLSWGLEHVGGLCRWGPAAWRRPARARHAVATAPVITPSGAKGCVPLASTSPRSPRAPLVGGPAGELAVRCVEVRRGRAVGEELEVGEPSGREPLERTEVTPAKSPAVARRPALRPRLAVSRGA